MEPNNNDRLKKSIYFVVLAAFVFLSGRPQLLAVSSIVCTLIAVVINTFPNRKLIGYRYRWQIADILPNLILSGVMCVVVVLMGQLPMDTKLLLPMQIIAGVAVYVGLSLATKNESFHYLLDYGKQIFKRG